MRVVAFHCIKYNLQRVIINFGALECKILKCNFISFEIWGSHSDKSRSTGIWNGGGKW